MRILQVDYMGCLYWYHHAKDRNATWNFLKRLRDIIQQFRVDRTLLLLEGGSTYRLSIHPSYKAARKKRKEEQTLAEKRELLAFTKEAEEFAQKTAPLFGIIPLRVYGAEADDLAAYLCQHIDTEEHQILNLSGDKDWYQLLRRNVVQASFQEIQKELEIIPPTVWLSESGFVKRYGIPVEQWIWMKCLAGDTGDSVPGFDHLGETTALEMLRRYGSIEGIERNLADLDVPRMRKQAKEALQANFQLVQYNYKVMNLRHSHEEEQAILGTDGICYLNGAIGLLPAQNRVEVDRLVELSYERGWLEIDKGWLAPFCGVKVP